ncbi:hypothetical protein GWK47_034097 [Chionoecetes opilio]|uniref:Uncharacterized protein n=1 Tax=Chionoecetes opilio TaxID=41210 RepID=A0A8J4YGF9_CHIOP|nr:hypothetical protein GWK47_034097 [Chionoecetes opilio]
MRQVLDLGELLSPPSSKQGFWKRVSRTGIIAPVTQSGEERRLKKEAVRLICQAQKKLSRTGVHSSPRFNLMKLDFLREENAKEDSDIQGGEKKHQVINLQGRVSLLAQMRRMPVCHLSCGSGTVAGWQAEWQGVGGSGVSNQDCRVTAIPKDLRERRTHKNEISPKTKGVDGQNDHYIWGQRFGSIRGYPRTTPRVELLSTSGHNQCNTSPATAPSILSSSLLRSPLTPHRLVPHYLSSRACTSRRS